MPGHEPLSVIILAGGRSKRMGRDKVWMVLDGQPLIEHVVRRLLPLADELLISAGDAQPYGPLLSTLPLPGRVVADVYAGFGPLAGIHAGLRAACNDLALVVAADMPFLNVALIEHMIGLAAGVDAVVPQVDDPRKRIGGPEPLHALYRRSCLPAIEAHLAAYDRQIICFFPEVRIRDIPTEDVRRFDPSLLSFFNINTHDDWLQSQRLAEQHGPS